MRQVMRHEGTDKLNSLFILVMSMRQLSQPTTNNCMYLGGNTNWWAVGQLPSSIAILLALVNRTSTPKST